MIDRLAGYSLLRTDQHGTIHLISDGEKIWVKVDRLP
jgi:beta-lactamase superfamily II metal-dependent hydrolase